MKTLRATRTPALWTALCAAVACCVIIISGPLFRIVNSNPPSKGPCPAEATGALDPGFTAAGPDKDWRSGVTSGIEGAEYLASEIENGLQAPNRAQNLRTYFRTGGIDVVPRRVDGEAASWQLTWRTSRWGRPGRLEPVQTGAARPHVDGARVTYVHADCDDLEEWYENRPEGIEQGFTVRKRPSGHGSLTVAGQFGGGLHPELSFQEAAVDLIDEHGARVLRYGELHVWDATQKELPSHLELEGIEVALAIDDNGATYPLTIDPIMTSPAWTAESDQGRARAFICPASCRIGAGASWPGPPCMFIRPMRPVRTR